MSSRAASVVLLIAVAAPAQTFLVDIQNGPGTDFTTIGGALAAVPDGSTLLVRAGQYPAFQIGGRSVSILGEPGAVVEQGSLGAVLISGISATQQVVLRGLGWSSTSGQAMVWIASSQGTIVVDSCYSTLAMAPDGGLLRITNCDAVHVRDTVVVGRRTAVEASHSAATFTRSTLRCLTFETGIAQHFGRVELDDCLVEGSGGVYPFELNPVVVGVAPGDLVVRGGTRLVGYQPGGAYYGIGGHGAVVVDPNTMLMNVNLGLLSPVLLATAVQPLASCQASTGPLGTSASATLAGPAGSAGFLLAGFPGARRTFPVVDQAFWLMAGSEITVAVGGSSVAAGYAVPNVVGLRGLTIAWQGLTFDALNGAQFSNPSIYAHH